MKLNIVEAPAEDNTLVGNTNGVKLFLAGGITGCSDWQSEFLKKINSNLEQFDLTIFNPRRKDFDFDINSKSVEEFQIVWEHRHLYDSDVIVFWFPKGGLCQITLYELGRWGNSSTKPIVIGIEKGFERTNDVKIQTMLSRKDVPIYNDFDSFVKSTLYICKKESERKKFI